MSDLAFNIWGVVGGVLFAFIPALIVYTRARLPSRNLPSLLDLFKETQELFSAAVREGLVTDAKELHQLNLNMLHATIRIDDIRAQVYDSKTWADDLRNWWHGLTGRIYGIHHELNEMRVALAIATSKGRRLRASQGLIADITLLVDDKENAPVDFSIPLITATPHAPRLPLAPALEVYQVLHAAGNGIHVTAPRTRDVTSSKFDSSGDGGCPPLYQSCHSAAKSACSAHPILSSADFQDLLSLALFHPLPEADAGKRERAMRREILLRFGRELCGVEDGAGNVDDLVEPERYNAALLRLSSRVNGETPDASDDCGETLGFGPSTPQVARGSYNGV